MEQRTINSPQGILPAEAPWQSCIAVCQKCAGKVNAMDGEKTRLRVSLKELIGERGLKKKVRAVDASCFDICPEDKITVVHFTGSGVRATNVGANTAAGEILEKFGF